MYFQGSIPHCPPPLPSRPHPHNQFAQDERSIHRGHVTHRNVFNFSIHTGNLICGVWDKAKETNDPEITKLAESLPHVIQSAVATSTLNKYEGGWKLWQQWASSKPEVQEIPADPWYVAIYLNHILHTNGTKGALHSAAYGIRWAHHVAGYSSPLEDPFAAMALKGCERLCAKPIRKKDPLTVNFVKELVEHYGPLTHLKDTRIMRFLVMVLVGFAGFLRIDEMLKIQRKHVKITDTHMTIFLPQCKNDQMRKGNEVPIARTSSQYCPVAMTEFFWKKAGIEECDEDAYFLPRLARKKRGHIAYKSKGISDTTAREDFREFIRPLATNGKFFTPHSLRSGGASQAAASGVEERLISKHGRWRSERARNGYLEDTVENRLKVSRSLGL